MALKLLSSGRWRNTETGRFEKSPVESPNGKYYSTVTGEAVEVKLPAYKSVAREYKASKVEAKYATQAAKTPSKPLTGEEFLRRHELPPVEASTSEALQFKRGVVNMGVVRNADRATQLKLRKMDADNLLKLYRENPNIFDMYFAYETDEFGVSGYYDYDELDIMDYVVERYEAKFGVIK